MFYKNTSPPLGLIHWPTKWLPASEAKNKYAGAISSTLAMFPFGMLCLMPSSISSGTSASILVSVAPGATQLALIFLLPISNDNDLVKDIIAPFAAV